MASVPDMQLLALIVMPESTLSHRRQQRKLLESFQPCAVIDLYFKVCRTTGASTSYSRRMCSYSLSSVENSTGRR